MYSPYLYKNVILTEVFLCTKPERCDKIINTVGGVAQLGERTVRIRKVKSSILSVSTKSPGCLYIRDFFIEEVYGIIYWKAISLSFAKSFTDSMKSAGEKPPADFFVFMFICLISFATCLCYTVTGKKVVERACR